MTPEEKLCSRRWRLTHSAWMLFSILSLGILTWAGFLRIAIKSKKKAWFVSAAAWLVVTVVLFSLTSVIDMGTKANPAHTPESGALGGFMTAQYVGGIIHSVISNRKWLLWRAHHVKTAWYAGSSITPIPAPSTELTAEEIDKALRSDAAPATTVPVQMANKQDSNLTPVDLNMASVEQLASITGLSQTMADRIVSTRARLGGFNSVDQLMTEAQVPPHIFVSIKDRFSVSSASRVKSTGASARRLDI